MLTRLTLLLSLVLFSAEFSFDQPAGKKSKSGTPGKTEKLASADISSRPISVGVTNLGGKGISEDVASTLTDALRAELLETGRFAIMEREQMNEILKEQGFQQSGACSEEGCLVEMGQILGVDHLVTGSVGLVGQTFSINVRLVDMATGKILKNIKEYFKGKIDHVLTTVIKSVALQLAGQEVPIELKNKITKLEESNRPRSRSTKYLWTGLAGITVGTAAGLVYLNIQNSESPAINSPTGGVLIEWAIE